MSRNSFRPRLDILGDRLVPAALLSDGVLSITGLVGADTIVVSQSGTNALVTFNSVDSLFKLANITSVAIHGGLGNDTITCTLDKPITIFGDGGNDTITAARILGKNNAVLNGNDGDDTIASPSRVAS